MTNNAAKLLKNIRDQIDQIDDDINQRLLQRFSLAYQIAEIKTLNDLSFYQPDREKQHISELLAKSSENHHIKLNRLWREIMTLSLLEQVKIQCHILNDHSMPEITHAIYQNYSPNIDILFQENLNDSIIDEMDLVLLFAEKINHIMSLSDRYKIISKIITDAGKNLYIFSKTYPIYKNVSHMYMVDKNDINITNIVSHIEEIDTKHMLLEINEAQHDEFKARLIEMGIRTQYLGSAPL